MEIIHVEGRMGIDASVEKLTNWLSRPVPKGHLGGKVLDTLLEAHWHPLGDTYLCYTTGVDMGWLLVIRGAGEGR